MWEQASYGITQMRFEVTNVLDTFWFMSNTGANEQPWRFVESSDWDPCDTRAPPPMDVAFPPLWHACSTYNIKELPGFRIHKDHIHKDLLDCKAPLIHYPPRDVLSKYRSQDAKGYSPGPVQKKA